MRPDVSILLPTKDRPARLACAIASIAAQRGATWELVISNGGAPLPDPEDDRITVLERPEGLMGGAAYNHMAEYARGKLMHVSADDDIMLPGTLASAIGMEAEWSYARIRFVDDGRLGEEYDPGEWWHSRLWGANFIPVPSVFWTRRLFDKADGFDSTLTYVADYEMWARFGVHADPHVRNHVDYLYSRWDGSVSTLHEAEIKAESDRLQERWQLIGLGNRDVR